MTDTRHRIAARGLLEGTAHGQSLLLAAPLSFWGGYDPVSGKVVDKGHANCGETLTSRVMLMGRSKGSSSSSSVLAEAIRRGTGPAAIVMCETDLIIALGAFVARELYGITIPIVVVDAQQWQTVASADAVMRVVARVNGQASISW